MHCFRAEYGVGRPSLRLRLHRGDLARGFRCSMTAGVLRMSKQVLIETPGLNKLQRRVPQYFSRLSHSYPKVLVAPPAPATPDVFVLNNRLTTFNRTLTDERCHCC